MQRGSPEPCVCFAVVSARRTLKQWHPHVGGLLCNSIASSYCHLGSSVQAGTAGVTHVSLYAHSLSALSAVWFCNHRAQLCPSE